MIFPEGRFEPDYPEPIMECPHCGAELYEGDKIYQIQSKGRIVVTVCEHCLEYYASYVEDL